MISSIPPYPSEADDIGPFNPPPKRPAGAAAPGDRSPAQQIARMIRVNQAGEYGAKRIYEGQLAILGRQKGHETIRHMAAQEALHLAEFDQLLLARRVRPTLLQPLWHAAGFALGAATALLGREAAMACTVAVEEVIDTHYARQLTDLKARPEEAKLQETIARFRDEEIEHRDIGLAEGAEKAPAYPLLTITIKQASRLAIWLSERL